jgi:RNA polymerase sigma-70 factor (ECF subfamily)
MSIVEFNDMVLKQEKILVPYALRLTRNTELAKDLCQETFYKAFANREKFENGTNIKGWLCTVMHNIFVSEYTRNKRRKMPVAYPENILTSYPAAEEKVKVREIHSAIYRLPGSLKQCFQLYLAGYKYQEIAEALRKPLGTIKGRIRLARKRLQTQLN